jgi:hypothetical protein
MTCKLLLRSRARSAWTYSARLALRWSKERGAQVTVPLLSRLPNRVGGGFSPPPPHHPACGSAPGGSQERCRVNPRTHQVNPRAGFEPQRRLTSSPGRVPHSVESVRLLPASTGSALHPVPAITAGRLATMASADFCPFTSDVTIRRAASVCGRVRWPIQDFRSGPQSGSRGTPRLPNRADLPG